MAFAEARRVLDPHAAGDAAQEALIRAWRHADACRTPQHPAPWLRAIARREALRIATARRCQDDGEQRDPVVEVQHSAQLRVDVQRAAGAVLTSRERELIAFRYWLDYSDQQIAAALDIPLGTAKIRLHRARRKLAAALVPDGSED